MNFFVVMSKDGKEIQPEGLLNLNAGLIMLTCFLFGALSGKMKAITSMVIGTVLATAAMFLSGYSTLGWISVFAIFIFSIGEMLSSPKFNEYIGNFAPADKKAMYLGFSQASLAIGWTLEGKVGPVLYEKMASKEVFARQALAGKGLSADEIAAIPQGEGFAKLVELSGSDKWTVTHDLYAQHHASIGMVWYIMGGIGIVSAFGIYMYGVWVKRRLARAS